MQPKFPFVRPRHYPNCFVIAVQLRGAPTRRQHHDVFVTLHREARHHGLVMGRKVGLCVFFGAERLCTNHSRHQMINWLVDHRAVRAIHVSELMALVHLFQPDGPLIRRLGDIPEEDRQTVHILLERAAWGTVNQWLAFLRGDL
jgi:uncharacterized protein YggL (DUF469 family)